MRPHRSDGQVLADFTEQLRALLHLRHDSSVQR
jgi:hypothetical protein